MNNLEDSIRRHLEGDPDTDTIRAYQDARRGHTRQQPHEVETALVDAIGGHIALNNDQALGRIAGGPGATINH